MKSRVVQVCCDTAGVSAEAKLYLVSFIARHRERPVLAKEEGLGKQLGISARMTSRVVGELVGAGYLLRGQALLSARPGKPASELRVKPELLEAKLSNDQVQLWNGKDQGGHFERVIDWLLKEPPPKVEKGAKPRQPPSQKGAAQRLSASNRLLLMLLLGLADPGGVVRRWQPSGLAELAGLTKVALQGQLSKLTDLGYLRTVVAGVSGQSLFGVRPGAIFLNLSHPHYKGGIPEVVLLYPVEVMELDTRSQGEAKILYQQFQTLGQKVGVLDWGGHAGEVLRRAGLPQGSGLGWLARRFDGVGTSTLPDYLQMKVEEYAVMLLNQGRCGGDLVAASLRLRGVIDEETQLKGGGGVTRGQERLVQLMLFLADRLAGLVWDALRSTSDLEGRHDKATLDEWTYTLVPQIAGANGRYLAITAVPRGWLGGTLGYRVLIKKEGMWIRQSSGYAMSKDEQYEYGLLTTPRQDLEAKKRGRRVREHLFLMAEEGLRE